MFLRRAFFLFCLILLTAHPIGLNAQEPEESAAPPRYSPELRAAVDKAAGLWIKGNKRSLKKLFKGPLKDAHFVVVLEVNVGETGLVEKMALARPVGEHAINDMARAIMLLADPLPPPPGELVIGGANIQCLVRFVVQGGKKPSATASTACFNGVDSLAEVDGIGDAPEFDAASFLFHGWAVEIAGDSVAAQALYQNAVALAPGWDLAARALALALVKNKKVDDAMGYIKSYVVSRVPADALGYAREVQRYAKYAAAKVAEQKRVRKRLSMSDIAMGLQKGYALLNPCLEPARNERALKVGADVLVMSWTVEKDGSVSKAHLDGPDKLTLSKHAECLEKAVLSWRFPQFSEGNAMVVREAPIKVRGSAPEEEKIASNGASAEAPAQTFDEPTFSQCMRSGVEISDYIRARFRKLTACVRQEKARTPKTRFPDLLPISFVVDTDGTVRNIEPGHRFFREGEVAQCLKKSLAGTMDPSTGADCPSEFNLDLRGFQ